MQTNDRYVCVYQQSILHMLKLVAKKFTVFMFLHYGHPPFPDLIISVRLTWKQIYAGHNFKALQNATYHMI